MKKLAGLFVLVLAGCAAKTVTVEAPAETVSADGPACVVPGTNRCIDYGACSLQADLRGADGDTLAMYERERKEDGTTYTAHPFPSITAKTIDNVDVSSASLSGKTVFVTLAAHCKHSFDSVPVLNAAVEQFGKDVHVVGIVVNSGSPEDVSAWIPSVGPKFDVWVHTDTDIGDRLGSHLVPTWFFVDDGNLERKLVGFQEGDTVTPALTDLTS